MRIDKLSTRTYCGTGYEIDSNWVNERDDLNVIYSIKSLSSYSFDYMGRCIYRQLDDFLKS